VLSFLSQATSLVHRRGLSNLFTRNTKILFFPLGPWVFVGAYPGGRLRGLAIRTLKALACPSLHDGSRGIGWPYRRVHA